MSFLLFLGVPRDFSCQICDLQFFSCNLLLNLVLKMVECKDMHSFSPVRIPKLQLAAEQPSTGECCIPPKTKYSMPKGKGEAQQEGGRYAITFRIKPQTHQRHSEGANKTLYPPGPRERSSDLHKRLSQT